MKKTFIYLFIYLFILLFFFFTEQNFINAEITISCIEVMTQKGTMTKLSTNHGLNA